MTSFSAITKPAGLAPSTGARFGLQIVDPTSHCGWDELVATHPGAGFFHTASWARTLVDAYGHDCRYLAAVSGHRLLSLLPVIEVRSWLRGRRGVSLPFTDECSPLTSPQVGARDMLDAAIREGENRGWKYLELRGGHQAFGDLPEAAAFCEHVLPIHLPADQLFKSFSSPVRRAIRKAEREGVTVTFGNDLEFLRDYYRLHCRTRTRNGAPPQPFKFFRAIGEHVLQKGRGFVALARHEKRPIAGAVFFQFGHEAIYKFSASDTRCQALRGPNLILGRALRKLGEMGVTSLNFGRTSLSNPGLRRFKCGWGAKERSLSYARYSFARREFVKKADLTAGVPARAFAMMPVFFSRWVGRVVYPHLSCAMVWLWGAA